MNSTFKDERQKIEILINWIVLNRLLRNFQTG